jgi:hypothetical protein
MRSFVWIVPIVSVFTAVPACATTILYTNRLAWEAASTGLATIDFEGPATPGNPISDSTAAGLTISGIQFIGVTPPDNYYLFVQDYGATWGSGDLLEGPNSIWIPAAGAYIEARLPAGVTAVGADLMSRLPVADTFVVSLSTGESFTVATSANPNRAFVGFTSDVPITSIRFHPGASYALLDNFSYGSAVQAAEVPEADTMILGCTGLFGLLIARRLRRWAP